MSDMTCDEFLAIYRDANTALHRLWSDAVGKEGYDKREWKKLEIALTRFGRDAATQAGIGRTEPLI